MAKQLWKPITLNGTAIDGTGNILMEFRGGDNSPYTPGAVRPVVAQIPGGGIRDVRGDRMDQTWEAQVILTASDETDIATMMGVFSEEAGLVWLRAQDGQASPVTWRIPVRVVQSPKAWFGTQDHFTVVLYVPSPVWETDTETTTSVLDITDAATTPIPLSPNNTGSRKTYPVATWTADAAKGVDCAANDWPWTFRTFAVSHQPRAKTVPVWLGDQTGAAGRFATDTSAAGATVRQTTGATTLNEDLDATETDVDLVDGTGFSADGGIATIRYGTGATEEQITYTGKAAATLTGVVRGAGGTTAQTHPNTSAITPGGTLRDGRDVAVWVDDNRVPDDQVWPVAWGTSASDVVVNLPMPEAKWCSLAATLGSATTGAVGFNESVAHMPEAGFIAIEDEIAHFTGKVGANGLYIDARGLWGTTAASHAAAVKASANPFRIVVACGYAQAAARPTSLRYRPCVQLPGSNNQVYKWGDESDDANTIFFNRDFPDRSMQWEPGFDADGNTVSPLLSISASGTILTFKDDVPGDGNPPYNFAKITIPQGIDAGNATAVIADWTPSAEILNLEMFAEDAQGVLKLIDELQQSAADADRSPAAFSNNMYGLKLKGRYNIATGFRGSDSSTSLNLQNSSAGGGIPPPDNIGAFKLTILEDGNYSGIVLRVRLSAAGSDSVYGYIVKDNGGLPDVTANGILVGLQGDFSPAITSTTGEFVKAILQKGQFFRAGTYWLLLWQLTTAAPTIQLRGASSYQQSQAMNWVSPTWTSVFKTPWYYLLSDYDSEGRAIIYDDQPVVDISTGNRTAITASFDKPRITLEPTQSVYVHRNTAFVTGATAGALYHLQGTLTNTTSGDTAIPDVWLELTSTLEIDCGADLTTGTRKVTKSEEGLTYPLTGVVTFSNLPEWLPMSPGVNAFEWEDLGLTTASAGQADLAMTHHGRKV